VALVLIVFDLGLGQLTLALAVLALLASLHNSSNVIFLMVRFYRYML